MSDETAESSVARAVTVTIEPATEMTLAAVSTPSFRQYLRRAHDGPTRTGDVWREFVNAGCGTRTEITLRVTSVTGGDRIGEGTAVEFKSA